MIKILKKQPDFEMIDFVARAISRDKTRPPCTYIEVKTGRVTATDGQWRFHRVTPARIELKDGYYRPVRHTKTEIVLEYADNPEGRFPDVDQVTPSPRETLLLSPTIPKREIKNTLHLSRMFFELIQVGIGCLDFSHLSDLCREDPWTVDLFQNERKVVYFKGDTFEAVIMSLRTDV